MSSSTPCPAPGTSTALTRCSCRPPAPRGSTWWARARRRCGNAGTRSCPDGTVNPGDMTSFNHYALGSVADWLHGTVAGLRQSSPAGDAFTIAPRPGGGLSWAQAWLETAFGRAEVAWKVEGRSVAITVDRADRCPRACRPRRRGRRRPDRRTPRACRRPRPADGHLSASSAATPARTRWSVSSCPSPKLPTTALAESSHVRATNGLTTLTGFCVVSLVSLDYFFNSAELLPLPTNQLVSVSQ